VHKLEQILVKKRLYNHLVQMQNYQKFHKKNLIIRKIVQIIKNLITLKEKYQILSTEYRQFIQWLLHQIKL